MNKQEFDLMNAIYNLGYENQRELAESSGYSLGSVNKSLKVLVDQGYLSEDMKLTSKANKEFNDKKPKNAVILAAGYGMRMVPINTETPKGLLCINNEALIERLIKQLHEVGITEIDVVVGFMKENYEYLIDEFGVNLVVNEEYNRKNNLHSLSLVADKISNTYIVPCDVWCKENPFSERELYSWYMVSDSMDDDSDVCVNRKNELVAVGGQEPGNKMIGISYITMPEAKSLVENIKDLSKSKRYDNSFWEEGLYKNGKMIVHSRVVKDENAVEINTFEQLREIDKESNHLKSDAIEIICKALNVKIDDIKNIETLKKGMTNRSFIFSVGDNKYIMRIPGEGTDKIINRKQEAAVYDVINGKGICEDIYYMNPDNGYKITKFLSNTRVCDCENEEDLKIAMDKLRKFHSMELKVDHVFDVFEKIDYYESLWGDVPSVYKDHKETRRKVFELKEFIDSQEKKWTLTHIDAVADNFLFVEGEEVMLIDWEYAGMQDPHVDIAMFCIYAMYDKEAIDRLIDIYFENQCDVATRAKIYCYIAMCGFLWSNWCEYKRQLGVEFGEYTLKQYRYAKEFYVYAKELIEKDRSGK